MTVEFVETRSMLGGLIKRRSTEVADYRYVEEEKAGGVVTSGLKSPRLVMLHQEPQLPGNFDQPQETTWAIAKGTDEVEVWDSNLVRRTNIRRLVGKEINQANLKSFSGKVRITWRETKPGDYPEPKRGHVVEPCYSDRTHHGTVRNEF